MLVYDICRALIKKTKNREYRTKRIEVKNMKHKEQKLNDEVSAIPLVLFIEEIKHYRR
jgi:hypothetical protein